MNLVTIPISMDALFAVWALRQSDDETTSQIILRIARVRPEIARVRPEEVRPIASSPPTPMTGNGKFRFNLLGIERRSKTAIEAYEYILRVFADLAPELPEKLSRLARSRSRNHIAKTPAEVYPKRPDLGKNAFEFAPSWFAGKNISYREKAEILRHACNVLGFEYGKDLIFGNKK